MGLCEAQFGPGLAEGGEPDREQAEVEANRLCMRESLHERPEPREREARLVLVVEADRGRNLRVGIVRSQPRRAREQTFRGDRLSARLPAHACDEQPLDRRVRPG